MIIDASRGGEDEGILRGGILEKDFNLEYNLFKKRVGIQLWTDEIYERLLSKEERINEGVKE